MAFIGSGIKKQSGILQKGMHGLIVFDRALTSHEQAIVTSSLDRLMGL